MLTYIKS